MWRQLPKTSDQLLDGEEKDVGLFLQTHPYQAREEGLKACSLQPDWMRAGNTPLPTAALPWVVLHNDCPPDCQK